MLPDIPLYTESHGIPFKDIPDRTSKDHTLSEPQPLEGAEPEEPAAAAEHTAAAEPAVAVAAEEPTAAAEPAEPAEPGPARPASESLRWQYVLVHHPK